MESLPGCCVQVLPASKEDWKEESEKIIITYICIKHETRPMTGVVKCAETLQAEHHWRRNRNHSQFPDSGDILTLLTHQQHHHHHYQPHTACPDSKRARADRKVKKKEKKRDMFDAVSSLIHVARTRHTVVDTNGQIRGNTR